MQCPHCNWQNPKSYKDCFSCGKPLGVATDAVAANPFVAPGLSEPPAPMRKPVQRTESEVHYGAAEPDSLMRVFATLVDAALIIVSSALLPIFGMSALHVQGMSWSSDPLISTLVIVVSILLPFVITGWLNSLGGSIGKRLFGLRVVTTAGDNPGVLRATLREILKYASNLGVPFLFHFFNRAVFSDQYAHNVITDVYVVRRKAGPNNLRRYIDSHAARRKSVRVIAITAVSLVVLLVGGGLTISMVKSAIYDSNNPDASAARDAVGEIVQVVKPVTGLAASHYARTGSFAADIDTLGVSPTLPSGISALQVDQRNGAITATIDSAVANGRIHGKHITWVPQFKTGKKSTELKRWQCGSPDIPKEELPSSCDADTKLLLPQ